MASTRDQRGSESATDTTQAEVEPIREELELLRRTHEAQTRELELLRLAHDAQARHQISERLAFADEIGVRVDEISRLNEEVEWRKGVMEEFERRVETLEGQLAAIHGSRTFRYTAPIRSLRAALRGPRG